MHIQENVSLAALSTIGVGGAARYYVEATSEENVIAALEFAEEKNLPVFILGGGSNIIVGDAGYRGLVLRIALKGIELKSTENNVLVHAAAGEDWDALVEFCIERNLAGIECLSGIPGSVGGTPVQNVGAYGQEVSETIVSVRVYDQKEQTIRELTNAECGFAYRSSIFNTTERNRYIVLAVTFRLLKNGEPRINYRDLERYFQEKQIEPTLPNAREAVLETRRAKSMVIAANDPDSKSAGSFFKNPTVSKTDFQTIENLARNNKLIGESDQIPQFPAANEMVKIPAAWLIERSGFTKGYARGRAGLSSKHTLAIVNRGDATANDVFDLMREIQDKVHEVFGVQLAPEPIFIVEK